MNDAAQVQPLDPFRRLFDAETMPFLVLTPDLTVIEVNTAYLGAALTTREATIGKNYRNVFPKCTATGTGNDHEDIRLDTGGLPVPTTVPVREYEVLDPGGGGHRRYWSRTTIPLLNRHGKLDYLIQRIDDFTDTVRSGAMPPDDAWPPPSRAWTLHWQRDALRRTGAARPAGRVHARADSALPRILVVGEQADTHGDIARLLAPHWNVECVAGGCAALATVAARPPHLLIADALLPGMSGIELVRTLRADARNAALPILLVSADPEAENRVAAIDAGANDYLATPVCPRELQARVTGLLAQGALIRRERHLRHQALGDKARLERIMESLPDNLLAIGRDWRIDLLNTRAAATLGHAREALLGKDFRVGAAAAVVDAVRHVMDARQPLCIEHFDEAGKRWWDVRLSPSPEGGVVVYSADITERKQAEERELHVAQHDALTGLSNRRLLHQETARMLANARRSGGKFAVLFLDLDGFKPINDRYGHAVGDKLLQAVAERIARSLRAEDMAGRVGGDEFVAVLAGTGDAENVAHVAASILDAVRRVYTIDGLDLQVSASMGISLFPQDGDTVDALIQHADTAMYRAKRAGPSRYGFYRDGAALEEPPMTGTAMAARLRTALDAQEFSLVFQPVFATGTSRVVEAEAMLRWRQADGSHVDPEVFLLVAEVTGLIMPIGDWLIRAACTHQVAWRAAGLPEISVAVKVSGVQFRQRDFDRRVAEAIRDTGIAPARLLLEIAEHTLSGNIDESIRMLTALKRLGVGVIIANFGAQTSNIRALTRIPADRLKIDRSFLSRRHGNGGNGGGNGGNGADSGAGDEHADGHFAAADAIIGLGHSLHREVVAHGIEHEGDMAYVSRQGCEYSQGYLLGRPMPAEEFLAWWSLASRPAPDAGAMS